MRILYWFRIFLALHALALLAILIWYFFFEGFLGYGYGELVCVGLMLAAFMAVVGLLFSRPRRAFVWMCCACLLLMDVYIVRVFENVLR